MNELETLDTDEERRPPNEAGAVAAGAAENPVRDETKTQSTETHIKGEISFNESSPSAQDNSRPKAIRDEGAVRKEQESRVKDEQQGVAARLELTKEYKLAQAHATLGDNLNPPLAEETGLKEATEQAELGKVQTHLERVGQETAKFKQGSEIKTEAEQAAERGFPASQELAEAAGLEQKSAEALAHRAERVARTGEIGERPDQFMRELSDALPRNRWEKVIAWGNQQKDKLPALWDKVKKKSGPFGRKLWERAKLTGGGILLLFVGLLYLAGVAAIGIGKIASGLGESVTPGKK